MGQLAERLYEPIDPSRDSVRDGAVGHHVFPLSLFMKCGLKMDTVTVLNRISGRLNQVLLWIGAVFLIMMIVLTCGNIFLRIVWMPVKGTFELMGFFSAVATAFALGYTQIQKGHTGIDLVVNLFSRRTRRILQGINSLILTVFFCVLGWQLMKWGTTLREAGEMTETLRIAFYPFVYGVGVGSFGLALVLLVELLKIFGQEKRFDLWKL